MSPEQVEISPITLSPRAETIAGKRLYLKNLDGLPIEDFTGMCKRVARHLANSDAEYSSFLEVMLAQEFLPNSPCLVNAGVEGRPNQLSGCFVVPVEDSMEAIFDSVKQVAMIHKYGGGTGSDYSALRPLNSSVASTHGVASGPISFMKVFDGATEAVKQGGTRRGANMGVLRVDHPDIMDFIAAKSDRKSLQNFNLSVAITNKFMQAVQENATYDLVNPATGETTSTPAKPVWEAIINSAHFSGDPGLIFIDKINQHNPLTGEHNIIRATNPCVTGDTLILTIDGYKRIDSLVGVDTLIWNGYEWSIVTPTITGTNQDIFEVTFSDGSVLNCTPTHGFYTWQGFAKQGKQVKKTTSELQIGDKLQKYNFPVIEGTKELDTKYAYTYGFFCGDGSSEISRVRNSISLYAEKKALLEYLVHSHVNVCKTISEDKLFVKIPDSIDNKTFIPTAEHTIQTRLDYLAGLIDSDGTLNDVGGSIAIWSINHDYIMGIKRMLNTLGVNTTVGVGTKASEGKMMPNGKGGKQLYETQTCYRLVISAESVRCLVGLGLETHRVSIEANPNRDAARFITVKSIERKGQADTVYCFTEYKNHSGIFNGVMTAQCGEMPLVSWEACGLGSVNLSLMVSNGQVNFERLRKVVTIGITLLNRMMQKSVYPNSMIAERVNYSRKVGLGPMGLADLLIKLKIPFSSPDAVEIAENIAIVILDSTTLATHKLGAIEGTFPAFEEYKIPEHIRESLSRLGIAECDYTPANSTMTTVAPTGTISMIAECSASIEPIYKFIQFENRADTIIEHHHPLYAKWKELYPNAPIPSYYEEAHDISPQQHIAIQAIFQKYTCSGVSKTINLPSHATKKDVADAYFLAYRSGCKGITVYRDGSLDNQVLSGSMPNGATANSNVITPLERPKALKGDTYQIKTGYGEMLVTVNYHAGKPFEILCTLGKSGASEMAKAEGISRLASVMLRSGISPDIIVGQLEGIKGSTPVHTELGLVESIPDAISKVITHYVLDNNHAEKAIPAMMQCGEPTCKKSHGLVKVGSCIKCTLCGWESCGG